jgi:hypothetical protein
MLESIVYERHSSSCTVLELLEGESYHHIYRQVPYDPRQATLRTLRKKTRGFFTQQMPCLRQDVLPQVP